MTYYGHNKTRSRITPEEWVPLAREVTQMVNKWSRREDLMAYVAPDAGRGVAPALYDPALAEVEVNVEQAFDKDVRPAMVGDMTQRSVQYEWPKASGAILHEALHAWHTTWDLHAAHEALEPNEYSALHLLEESRIEKRGVDTYPQNRQFLRSSALGLAFDEEAMDELKQLPGVRAAANMAGLSLARVDAGVLEHRDIPKIEAVINSVLPPEVLAKLRRIWREFQSMRRPDVPRMYTLARAWEAALKEESENQGESEGQSMAEALMDALAEAMSSDAQRAESDASRQLENQETQEKEAEAEAERKAAREEQSSNEEEAKKTFKPATSTTGQRGETNSVIVSSRAPEGAELAAAVRIGQELEKAKYRDRDKTEIRSFTPPGRMRSGAVLQNAAYAAKSLPARAEPFRRIARKHTDEPTLTIGMMTDVSGSMSAAMQPIAVANWVFSEASRRIQARIGSVYFGSQVTAGLAPGQHLDKITVRKAPDGYEAFDSGFRSLDGGLNLLNGVGARLLVVCSDGNFKYGETDRAKHWLKRCEQEGVGVLWLTFSGTYGSTGAEEICADTHVEIHHVEDSPTDAAYTIGSRAAQALTRAGAGR